MSSGCQACFSAQPSPIEGEGVILSHQRERELEWGRITPSPIEAGLERFVRNEGQFVGSEVLTRQREGGTARKLAGLTLPGRSAPRAGYSILAQGQEVGRVTSGTYSPTLDTSIAMGYVLVQYGVPGQTLTVDMRGRATPVEVAPLPFYTRSRNQK